jgi:hypothetical protein
VRGGERDRDIGRRWAVCVYDERQPAGRRAPTQSPFGEMRREQQGFSLEYQE